MKLFKRLLTGMSIAVLGAATAAMAFSSVASADCFQYNANGFQTSTTPVFNNICGVPNLGNESDFVRVRQSSTTNAVPNNDEIVGPTYSIGSINAACNSGDLFDVWNYLHNDATATQNPDTGSGSAVAHNVVSNLSAPLGTTASSFKFSDTVTASNAATVSDSATINCGSKMVQLSLVPGSVHTVTAPTGGFNDIPDSSINNPLTIGNPTWGSGDQWGCWNYRILIIYEVKVVPVTPPKTPPTCNLLQFEEEGNVARIDNVEYTANDATVTGFSLAVTDNGTTTTQQIALNGFPKTFPIVEGHTYTYKATVLSNLGNVTSDSCVKTISSPTTPPVTPPPVTPPTVTPPTSLVNTGPGSVIALFLGATVSGIVGYNWFLKKKLSKNS